MRRALRFVILLFCILSTTLCLALVVLSIRSYFVADAISFSTGKTSAHNYGIRSDHGGVCIWSSTENLALQEQPVKWTRQQPDSYFIYPPFNSKPKMNPLHAGFGYIRGAQLSSFLYYGVVDALAVPYWPLLLITLLPATLYLRGHLRHRNRQCRNQCQTCGYDLRASPHRCPECGTAVVGAG